MLPRVTLLTILMLLVSCGGSNQSAKPVLSQIKSTFSRAEPVFEATSGATGIENQLAFGDRVTLGNIGTVGPNTGTLVRITNNSATASFLSVGLPQLSGADSRHFKIEIEDEGNSSILGLIAALESTTGATLFIPLPKDNRPGSLYRIDPMKFAQLRNLKQATLQRISLPELGVVTLELTRRPFPAKENAKLVIDGKEVSGGLPSMIEDLQFFSVNVADFDGSKGFLAMNEEAAHGFLALPNVPGGYVHIISDGKGVRFVTQNALTTIGLKPPPLFCKEALPVPGELPPAPHLPNHLDESTINLIPDDRRVKVVDLALETDFEFFQKFGATSALINYVTSLVGAVSDTYLTEVQTVFRIAYLGIHTTANDGWNPQQTSSDRIFEFSAAWGGNLPASANLAHFFSGANLGGGVAFLNGLCNQDWGFAVSGNMSGGIDWQTWTGEAAGFTWDFLVVAHELGHNFGSLHSQNYCPQIDRCWQPDFLLPWFCDGSTATVCSRGTMMSYCHQCPGGLANMDLVFHPIISEIMRTRVNSAACVKDAPAAVLSRGDYVQYRVRFNPLATEGEHNATLEFTHNARKVPDPFQLELSGNVIPRRSTGVRRR